LGFQVLTNCKAYLDAYDLTGASNQVELKYSADILDKTTFNDTGKRRVGGLKNVEIDLQGFWEAGDGKIDTLATANLGVAGKIITLGPTGGAAGELFYSFKNMLGEYQVGAAVGELLPFQYNGGGSNAEGLIRGTVLENAAKTATAAGTARKLGQVAAGQHLYAVMHVLAVSGTNPTLVIKIQSDDGAGFLSPEDRIAFAQATAVGAQWAVKVAGPITDEHWRASWTIGGTNNPSFTVFVGIAIQ
jgi:hypothetical protein